MKLQPVEPKLQSRQTSQKAGFHPSQQSIRHSSSVKELQKPSNLTMGEKLKQNSLVSKVEQGLNKIPSSMPKRVRIELRDHGQDQQHKPQSAATNEDIHITRLLYRNDVEPLLSKVEKTAQLQKSKSEIRLDYNFVSKQGTVKLNQKQFIGSIHDVKYGKLMHRRNQTNLIGSNQPAEATRGQNPKLKLPHLHDEWKIAKHLKSFQSKYMNKLVSEQASPLEQEQVKTGNTQPLDNYKQEEYMNIFINNPDAKEQEEQENEKQIKDEENLRRAFDQQVSGSQEIRVGSITLQTHAAPLDKQVKNTHVSIISSQFNVDTYSTANIQEKEQKDRESVQQIESAKTYFKDNLTNTLEQTLQASVHQGTVRMNRSRFQGKLVLEWLNLNLAHQTQKSQKCEGLSSNETQDYFQVCQNVNAIVDACLGSVIDCYAKAACQEWATILQVIRDSFQQSYQKCIRKQEKIMLNEKIEFEKKQKYNADKHRLKLEESDHIISGLEQSISQLKQDVEFEQQQNSVKQIRVEDQNERIRELELKIKDLQLEAHKKDKQVQILSLKETKHRSKKRFIKLEIQKWVKLTNELELEMIDVTKKKEELKLWLESKGEEVPEEIQKSSERSRSEYASEDESGVSDSQSDKDENPLPLTSNTGNFPESAPAKQADDPPKKKTKKLKQHDFDNFIHKHQKEYSEENLRQNKMIDSNGKKKETQKSVVLDSLAILDSESDELARSIINHNDKIKFPEDEAMRPLSGNQNIISAEEVQHQQQKERRFIKQGVFIKKFTEELRINEQYDKLHRYMQDKIINDEFLLRIITEPKVANAPVKKTISFWKDEKTSKSQKRTARSPSQNKEGSKGQKITPDAVETPPRSRSQGGLRRSDTRADKQQENKVTAFQHERRGYNAYLKPLMSLENLQNQFQKYPFKLRAENLFEILHAILGQMFLTQIDTIDHLMFDLKKKFPNHNYFINDNYVNSPKNQKDGPNQSTMPRSYYPKRNSSSANSPRRDSQQRSLMRKQQSQPANINSSKYSDRKLNEHYGSNNAWSGTISNTKKAVKTKSAGTQTGEAYDEFLIINSIKGIDGRLIYVEGENDIQNIRTREAICVDSTTIQLHKLDLYNKKLIKINLVTNKKKQLQSIEAEEYLPQDIVENFLPFNCVVKLDEMASKHVANIVGYENSRAKNKKVTEIAIPEFDLGYSAHKPLPGLVGYVNPSKPQSEVSTKKNTSAIKQIYNSLNFKDGEAQELLNEYHKVLQEATTKYPTVASSLQNIQTLCNENKGETKNSFSVLPPGHQEIITAAIEAAVEQQLAVHQHLISQKQQQLKSLNQYEFQIDRMNLKMKYLLSYIQELEVRRDGVALDIKLKEKPLKSYNSADFHELKKQLLRSHHDGFLLGLTQGKMLGSQQERNFILNQGQINGMKHGYLSGFQSGQIAGVKTVFVEAYMNNINLFDMFQSANKDASVLDLINIHELQRERMNEFHKMFKDVKISSNNSNRFQRLIASYKALGHQKKLQHKKIGKKQILKMIKEIYNEKQSTKQKSGKDISLVEAMTKHIALNYGHNNITDTRCFRVFSSALFNSSTNDQREELERSLFQNAEDKEIQKRTAFNVVDVAPRGKGKVPSGEDDDFQKRRHPICYQIIHFTKFCQLSEGMNNLSEEVLRFYLELLESINQRGHMADEAIEISSKLYVDDEEIEVVSQNRIFSVIQSKFSKMLPSPLTAAFKRSVERELRVKDEAKSIMQWVDLDRFLDHSIILFLRFNKFCVSPLNKLYFAWTMFSVDFIDFDQIYIMLKILADKDTQEITFDFPKQKQKVAKSVKEVMLQLHNKFGGSSQKDDSKSTNKGGGSSKTKEFELFGFENEERILGQNKKIVNLDEEGAQDVNHKLVTLMKIKNMQQQYVDRNDCCLSLAQFVQIFKNADFYSTKEAKNFMQVPITLMGQHQISSDKLIQKTFVENCKKRMNVLLRKKNALSNLILKVQRRQIEYMKENQINPETGKHQTESLDTDQISSLPLDAQLCKDKVQHHKPQAMVSRANETIEEEDEATAEDEPSVDKSKARGLKRKSTMQGIPSTNPLYDVKPYVREIKEWERRLQRLEQKMHCLAPELIYLSFEMHQQALNLLIEKMTKFIELEESWLQEQENLEAAKDVKESDQKQFTKAKTLLETMKLRMK